MVSRGTQTGLMCDIPTSQPVTKLGCPKPLVIELFPFVTKKVGKALKIPILGMCPGRFQGIHAVKLEVLMRLSKKKKHISEVYDVLGVLNVSVTGSNMCSLWRRRKSF